MSAIQQALLMARSGGASDPSFSLVKALLHMDGANNSTTFTDVIGGTFTAYGDAKISTAQSKFGGASAYLDGSGDRIEAGSHAAFSFSSGDFTIEAWVRCPLSADGGLICRRTSGPNGWALEIRATGAVWLRGKINGTYSDTRITTAAGVVSANTWAHVALVRSGSSWVIYVDGVSRGSLTDSGAIEDEWTSVLIGCSNQSLENSFTGYIDDLRVTWAARYSGTFTPPVAAFPDS